MIDMFMALKPVNAPTLEGRDITEERRPAAAEAFIKYLIPAVWKSLVGRI